MHKVCVKIVGFFEEPVCLEIEECISVENLLDKILNLKGIKVSLEAIAVSDGSRTLKLTEDICSYKELTVFRLFRGG